MSIEHFERAQKFAQAVLGGNRTLTIKADTFVPANWTPTDKCASDAEGLIKYFLQEFRMQDRNIRERGYASFFLVDFAGGSILHFRVMKDMGGYSVHYLD